MHDAEESDSRYLEDELRDFAQEATQDQALASALVSLSGWAGGEGRTIPQVSQGFGLSTDQVTQAKSSLDSFCKGKSAPILEEVIDTISGWLPCAVPTIGHWLAENNLVRSADFTISGVMEAADVFDIELPFKAVSKEHTKWLVDPDNDSEHDISSGDKIASKTFAQATRFGIVDPEQFSSLDGFLNSANNPQWFWESIEACTKLAVHNQSLIICRQPREDAEIVKRLDRLLSLEKAVHLPVALSQITRNGGKGVLPIADVDTLKAFITHCSYYTFDDGDVVSARPLIVDEEISALERPLIMALLDSPVAATFEELELITRKDVISLANVHLVLHTSPLIVNVSEDRYALFDASMYDDVVSGIPSEDSPESTADTSTGYDASVSNGPLDLADFGTTGEYWWAMYAGPIPLEQLEGAQRAQQAFMAILDPDTDKCVGLVLTSRVGNKYYAGNPSVLLTDKGLKGRELPRFVSPAELRSTLSETHLIFYNDPNKTGQGSWGIVFRGDVNWV